MLTPLEEIPKKNVRKVKSKFQCSCGNIVEIFVSNYLNGQKTCGKCKNSKYLSKIVNESKYGMLKLKNKVEEKYLKVREKYLWQCDCGNCKMISAYHVINGNNKACGCLSSTNKLTGGTTRKTINKNDLIKKCNYKILSQLDDEMSVSKIIKVQCKCGNILHKTIMKAISNKSCKKCKIRSADFWSKKFGRLSVINPTELSIYHIGKIKCKCDCGNETYIEPSSLVRPDKPTISCGNCTYILKKWWDNKEKLKQPLDMDKIKEYFNGCSIMPQEILNNNSKILGTNKFYKYKFLCKICGSDFTPFSLYDVIRNKVVSCGCLNTRTSYRQAEIYNYLKSCGFDPINEFKLEKYNFDIAIKNLIIEYDGLLYHNEKYNPNHCKTRFKKIKVANDNHYELISIFEDEWIHRKSCFKNLILNKLGVFKYKSLRPKQCVIKLISNKDVKDFYESYHYQGSCISKFNIGVFYGDTLISCMSIKNPTRQNSGDWEISRMASKSDFKVHGIWSYLIKWIKTNNLISGKLITFSDNRLMTGEVYNIMGFKHVSDVKPDYYWAKGNRRYHKSALRKTNEEKLTGKTESELRMKQGYYKVYDLGKKKWELIL
jgi:hypothetical protein